MSEIFGMFIFLQFIVVAPLIDIDFPSLNMIMFEILTQAATFDILYTDDWFPKIFKFGELKPYNKQFER